MIKLIFKEIEEISSSEKDLRNFGLIVGVVFVALSLIHFWFFGIWSFVIGGILVVMGVGAPQWLVVPHKIWMTLGIVLGFFVSRTLLIIIFLLVITPIGLIMRLLGKDTMTRQWSKKASTYWVARTSQNAEEVKNLY